MSDAEARAWHASRQEALRKSRDGAAAKAKREARRFRIVQCERCEPGHQFAFPWAREKYEAHVARRVSTAGSS